MFEYIIIFKFTILTIIIAIIAISLAYFLGNFTAFADAEKKSAYECGFDGFAHNTIINNFEIEFLLLALLFLIFDLELIFLVPWVINYAAIGFAGFVTIMLFLIILILGFFIEYFRGVLHWNKAKVKNEMH